MFGGDVDAAVPDRMEDGGMSFSDWDDRMLEYGGRANPFNPLRQLMMQLGGAWGNDKSQVIGGNNQQNADVQQGKDITQQQAGITPTMIDNTGQPTVTPQQAPNGQDSMSLNEADYNGNPNNPIPKRPWGTGAMNAINGIALGAGFVGAANANKEAQGAMRQSGQSDYSTPKVINAMGHGKYDPNTGALLPGATYQSKYGGRKMQMGGNNDQLQKGSVVDLDQEEISKLMRQGYKFAKV
jgi:hypothetical protein